MQQEKKKTRSLSQNCEWVWDHKPRTRPSDWPLYLDDSIILSSSPLSSHTPCSLHMSTQTSSIFSCFKRDLQTGHSIKHHFHDSFLSLYSLVGIWEFHIFGKKLG